MSRKIRKVVIPVAGLGSRFLPATKALPKELLPVVDRPIIHYIVQEAISAGIETVVFVTARPKILIEDYFDPHDLTSYRLQEAGKTGLIEDVLELSKKIEIVSVRQYEPHGLGHAVLQASSIVSGQNFAVVLGDDLIMTPKNSPSAIGQCIQSFESVSEGSVVGTIEVPREQTALYGVVALNGSRTPTGAVGIRGFVEKPAPAEAPSNLAMPGRYVFDGAILDFLRQTRPGKNGEIQLTDAMESMLRSGKHSYYAQTLVGERFDTGDKLGYIIANVAVALESPSLKEELSVWLRKKLGN